MASLLITKQPDDYFSFVVDGNYSEEISNTRNDLTVVKGNEAHFKTANGSNLIKNQQIYPSDVTIVDGATTLNPTTVVQLFSMLKSVGYFDWIYGTGGAGVDRFDELVDTFEYFGKDGQAVVVDEAQMKLIPVTFYNYKNFIQLEDMPNAYVDGKFLQSTASGAIWANAPTPPTDSNKLDKGGYPGTGQDLADADQNLQDQIDNIPSSLISSKDFARLLATQQNFTIPNGTTAKWMDVNGTTWYPETANNNTEFNTFTQSGSTVTTKTALEIGEYPVIFYQ